MFGQCLSLVRGRPDATIKAVVEAYGRGEIELEPALTEGSVARHSYGRLLWYSGRTSCIDTVYVAGIESQAA